VLHIGNVNLLHFYATPSALTDPGEHAERFADLPVKIATLCEVIQGLTVHIFWAERYGLSL
jgi:hypothetical protein